MTFKEVIRGYTTCAMLALKGHYGPECHGHDGHLGRAIRVGKASSYSSAVSNRLMCHMVQCFAQERHLTGHDRRSGIRIMGRHGANQQLAFAFLNAFQFPDRPQINQQSRACHAKRHHRQKRLPARQGAGIAVFCQQLNCFGNRGGAGI